MKFSDKLQKIRKENNITQEALADKLNVSRQAVSKWESGTAYPDTEKLIQISKIFNIKIDDLINDNLDMNKNKVNNDKKLSFIDILNGILEFISKTVNMFWSMRFTEKIKCIFETIILVLIILGIAVLSTSIMVDLLRRILMFLPNELIYNLCGLFETLLFLVWLVLGIIIVVKLFKTRYLDYYVIVNDSNVSEKIIEEPIKELKDKKEYKVVIRDPKDSSFNIFRRIEKIFIFFAKCLCFLVIIPLVLFFIFSVIMLVYSLFYLFDGIFFNGITISIFGVILFIFLIIEFIYNLLFNRNHAINRIFIIFIMSISMIGIGLGISFVALSNFSYEKNSVKEVNIHNIDMSENLVLTNMMNDMYTTIIIDNSINDIKLEIISYGNINTYLYSYDSYDSDRSSFKIVELGYDYNELEMYSEIINNLKDKKIVNYDKIYEIKMYISEDNLTKLRENINKYTGSIWFE